jgi:HSP20 family molecular chaperone IbpA
MTRLLEQAFSKIAALPDAQQDELARVLLELAGVDQPSIQLTAEEDADLAEAEAEIARGELATAEEVAVMWKKHGQ